MAAQRGRPKRGSSPAPPNRSAARASRPDDGSISPLRQIPPTRESTDDSHIPGFLRQISSGFLSTDTETIVLHHYKSVTRCLQMVARWLVLLGAFLFSSLATDEFGAKQAVEARGEEDERPTLMPLMLPIAVGCFLLLLRLPQSLSQPLGADRLQDKAATLIKILDLNNFWPEFLDVLVFIAWYRPLCVTSRSLALPIGIPGSPDVGDCRLHGAMINVLRFFAPDSIENRVEHMVNDLLEALGDKTKDAINDVVAQSTAIVVLAYLASVGWQFLNKDVDEKRQLFQKRVNIGLTMVDRDETGLLQAVKLRTIYECGLSDLIPDLDAQELFMGALEECDDDASPFVNLKKQDWKEFRDQIMNRLSSLFGKTYLQEDLNGNDKMVSDRYVFAVTWEKERSGLLRKIRIILIKMSAFMKISEADVNSPKLACANNKNCGKCGTCYNRERLFHLHSLQTKLQDAGLYNAQGQWCSYTEKWTKEKYGDEDWTRPLWHRQTRYEKIPLADNGLFIAAPRL